MDLTLSLRRDHKIPALFVAACSPALAHTPNVEKDAAFYSSLFEGTATLMNQDGDTVHNHIWKNGKLYETSLDCAGKEFEKLEFVPPCPMGISLEATNFKTGRTTGSEKGAPQGISPPIEPHKSSLPSNDSHTTATDEEMLQGLQHISSHVDSLQEDLRIRLRQINWRNTEMVCARRGIIVRDVDSSHVSDPSTNSLGTQTSSADLHALLVTLEVGIWPISRVEKLVNLAIGCRIEHGIRNNIPASHTSELSGMHILEALQVLQQSERVRLNRENTLNSLKDGSSAKKGHRFDHNLTYTGADSSSGKHRPEGHSSASESAPKQEQSDSAQLQEMLRAQGHRINAYEKKILSTVVNPDNIKVGFSDLVLPPTTKLLLQTLVTLPMLRPEFFAKGILSRSAINGVLLFGPPGTGKTMLAKAVAKSSGARFMNVALSNVLDKYVGEGEKNVRAVFTLARKLAPCVVFLDEVDALFAARRNDGSNSSRREIMNEFMAEWDGLTSNNNGVIVLGATNRPFDLDDAILRRMPRRILIDLPNEEARAVILKGLLVDELMDSSIDISLLAKKSALYSGSDLKSLCISAALARVKESIVRSLLQGDDKTAVSSDHVAAHLDRLDDWVKCLKPQSAQSSGPTGDNSAASVKFGASTSGRRHRSSNLPHTIGASAEPLKSSPSADSPESDLTSSSSTTSAAKVEVSSEDSSKKEGKPEPEMPGVVYDHNTEPLTSAHFDIAFTEVPPSLTDEMQTLIELRKWDGQFGDGAARRNAKKTRGWGFDFVDTGSRTTSSASGIQ
ncbi:hypothetical protein BASA61_010449 [Batrachochytrium salamandrivorans]|nr:hypothetical protein BASA61_010449 [Batrachochytrium salamandrivorans]